MDEGLVRENVLALNDVEGSVLVIEIEQLKEFLVEGHFLHKGPLAGLIERVVHDQKRQVLINARREGLLEGRLVLDVFGVLIEVEVLIAIGIGV